MQQFINGMKEIHVGVSGGHVECIQYIVGPKVATTH